MRKFKAFRSVATLVGISLILLTGSTLHAATASWTGGGDGVSWSDATNWSAGLPASEDEATFFGSLSSSEDVNNDVTGVSFARLNLKTTSNSFSWNIDGNPIELSDGIYDSSSGTAANSIGSDIVATDNLLFKASRNSNLTLAGKTHIGTHNLYLKSSSTSEGLHLSNAIKGTGLVIISGTGNVGVTGMHLESGGIINPNVIIRDEGSLMGRGRVGRVTTDETGKIYPAGYCINTRNLKLRGTYYPRLTGNSLCASYHTLRVTGTVDITDASLKFYLTFAPSKGKVFKLIENDGTDPVRGYFHNRPEGKVFMIGSYKFKISYKGHTGNDVIIVRL
jgi:hypothetical protein